MLPTQHRLTHVCPRQHKFQHVHLVYTCSSLYRSGKSTIVLGSIITLVKYAKDAKTEVRMVDFLDKMTIPANSITNFKKIGNFQIQNLNFTHATKRHTGNRNSNRIINLEIPLNASLNYHKYIPER